ncbi:hypothetical protein KP509_38G002600 [Ceratopteris richardii]|uniref:Uncharacterized protein n=1 Tax=Ceratopteris richardii TaxID=49495 RepID=A0A8T2Q1E7_CERRI|nr:hypothetical protein KP509_38G002600 [Ceratopteris richardii]
MHVVKISLPSDESGSRLSNGLDHPKSEVIQNPVNTRVHRSIQLKESFHHPSPQIST